MGGSQVFSLRSFLIQGKESVGFTIDVDVTKTYEGIEIILSF